MPILLLKFFVSSGIILGILLLEYLISEFIEEAFGMESQALAMLIAFGLTLVCFFILFVN